MASDLPLVVELIEMVDSSKIFGHDLPGGTALEECGQTLTPILKNILKNTQKYTQTQTPDPKRATYIQSDQFTSAVKVPMPKAKQNNNSVYDSFQTQIFSEADSFFGPGRERGARPLSAKSKKISDSAGLRDNTDSKLSQFFLLNKYWWEVFDFSLFFSLFFFTIFNRWKQNIILSLIQQLSVDLRTKSTVKFPFLQESILALGKLCMKKRMLINVLLIESINFTTKWCYREILHPCMPSITASNLHGENLRNESYKMMAHSRPYNILLFDKKISDSSFKFPIN